MTNLPTTLLEAEATQFARGWVAKCQAGDWLHIGLSMLHPEAGHTQLRQILKLLAASHPFELARVIADARAGWRDADMALRELTAEILDRGGDLPAQLRAYTIEQLRPDATVAPPGPQRASHVLQDLGMVVLVLELTSRFPGLAFCGRSVRKASICSIAAVAFTEARLGRVLTADAVRKIWKSYQPAIGDLRYFKRLTLEKLPV
jgi:hypothetical protein